MKQLKNIRLWITGALLAGLGVFGTGVGCDSSHHAHHYNDPYSYDEVVVEEVIYVEPYYDEVIVEEVVYEEPAYDQAVVVEEEIIYYDYPVGVNVVDDSGRAVPDAEVELIVSDRQETVIRGVTDGSGYVGFAVKAQPGTAVSSVVNADGFQESYATEITGEESGDVTIQVATNRH